MAYATAGLKCILNGGPIGLWVLDTVDIVGDADAAGYITDAGPTASGKGLPGRGLQAGHFVIVRVVSSGTVAAPTAWSDMGLYYVSAVAADTGAGTLVAFGAA